jgi:hypothetical protein
VLLNSISLAKLLKSKERRQKPVKLGASMAMDLPNIQAKLHTMESVNHDE